MRNWQLAMAMDEAEGMGNSITALINFEFHLEVCILEFSKSTIKNLRSLPFLKRSKGD
jgi:hypothetical protein